MIAYDLGCWCRKLGDESLEMYEPSVRRKCSEDTCFYG